MADMKIKSLAPWFGGKRTLAPDIVELLGQHTQYFEPFCGSMAVLFAKEPSRQETVNDLHGDLINLARVIADEGSGSDLYDRLCRTLFAEELLREAADKLAGDLTPADRAYWYFVQSWMMRNGVAGTNIGCVRGAGLAIAARFTAGGGSPTIRWRNAVESIPAWHERLRNVVILNRDAFSLMESIEDAEGVAIYADPPYPAETRSGFDGLGAQARYAHEFDHQQHGGLFGGAKDDHMRLAGLLGRFKTARVVVSTYDCPRYRELYDGWEFIDKTRQKNLHAQNGRGARPKEAPEVLICNRRTA